MAAGVELTGGGFNVFMKKLSGACGDVAASYVNKQTYLLVLWLERDGAKISWHLQRCLFWLVARHHHCMALGLRPR